MTKQDTQEVDIDAMLEQQARPRMVVPICLRGDLTSEIYRLDAKLVELGKENSDSRITGNVEARRTAELIKELEAEAKRFSINVVLQAMERGDWADLVAKHPAKDKTEDFNVSIYNDAIPACIVEPEKLLNPERRDKFLKGLTQGQWDELAGATHTLNVGDGSVPFSRLASRTLQGSDEK
jgi:hypothetical protein